MARDNFSKPVKTALAKRAGYRCSYPSCKATTVGPSDEGTEAVANTGEAAHISAASPGRGSRRYDPLLTTDQRVSIENGIWCCNVHAELIDTDEVMYTVDVLKKWKRIAERRAQLRQAHGELEFAGHGELLAMGLAPEALTVASHERLSEKIGSAVTHACIGDLAGKHTADTLRDFLIEYARNALSHGGATSIAINFEERRVTIVDNGGVFNLSHLSSPASRGGGMAYRALLKTIRLNGISSERSPRGENCVYIPFSVSAQELPHANPCAISISREDVHAGTLDLSVLAGCDRVYVVAPDFGVFSDGPIFQAALRHILSTHGNVVFVCPLVSDGVLEHYRALFAPVEVVSW